MNISSAYHIVQGLKGDVENSRYGEEAQYFISNMMGHVYNTCGNIPGAELEFLKSAEQTDSIAICRKAIVNMPQVDANKVKVKLDDQTNGDTMLYTNGDSLLLMLSYILENSANFTEKGHIILKVRTEKQKDQKMMLFSVEDTGCGIPSDKQATIFQRWMKVDEFKEGLGLAYCWETAQKLGGELTLDQTSEAGTTFTLRLPMEKSKN